MNNIYKTLFNSFELSKNGQFKKRKTNRYCSFAIILTTLLVSFLVYYDGIKIHFYDTDDWFLLGLSKDILSGNVNSNSRFYIDYFLRSTIGIYQILQMFLWTIQFYFFGFNQSFYHISNILLHGINAILLISLTLRFYNNIRVSVLTGLLFAIFPLNYEPVLATFNNDFLLCFLFFISTIILILDYSVLKGKWRIWLSILTCIASILSKELGLLTPFVCVAALYCFKRFCSLNFKGENYNFKSNFMVKIIIEFKLLIYLIRKIPIHFLIAITAFVLTITNFILLPTQYAKEINGLIQEGGFNAFLYSFAINMPKNLIAPFTEEIYQNVITIQLVITGLFAINILMFYKSKKRSFKSWIFPFFLILITYLPVYNIAEIEWMEHTKCFYFPSAGFFMIVSNVLLVNFNGNLINKGLTYISSLALIILYIFGIMGIISHLKDYSKEVHMHASSFYIMIKELKKENVPIVIVDDKILDSGVIESSILEYRIRTGDLNSLVYVLKGKVLKEFKNKSSKQITLKGKFSFLIPDCNNIKSKLFAVDSFYIKSLFDIKQNHEKMNNDIIDCHNSIKSSNHNRTKNNKGLKYYIIYDIDSEVTLYLQGELLLDTSFWSLLYKS